MRPITSKQLLRVFQGQDLEFRITEYPVKCLSAISYEGLVFPHNLNFKDSLFGHLNFVNCKFLGDINFNGSTVEELQFEGCQLKNIEIRSSNVKNLTINHSTQLQKIHVGSSSINTINIEGNKYFEAIELGCENHMVAAYIAENGNSELNSFKSTIYICPERFESIKMKNNTSEILHIGTIGEYASFEIVNYNANLVLFSNCNSNSTKVKFRKMKPIDPNTVSVCIVNSSNILEMHNEGLFSGFKSVKKYQQIEDFSLLRGIAS